MQKDTVVVAGAGFFTVLLFLIPFVAWVTHVVTCIVAHAWILLVLGALFFPFGIIHGIMVWFGYPAV